MYRRDLITAEIQKLAQVLARIMGLKLEGSLPESDELMTTSLETEFGITTGILNEYTNDQFESFLIEKDFPAEKLEILSQFLYFSFDHTGRSERNDLLAQRLHCIYQLLEVRYHIITMINLDRQQLITNYLNA